jgi:hypothetical protein
MLPDHPIQRKPRAQVGSACPPEHGDVVVEHESRFSQCIDLERLGAVRKSDLARHRPIQTVRFDVDALDHTAELEPFTAIGSVRTEDRPRLVRDQNAAMRTHLHFGSRRG